MANCSNCGQPIKEGVKFCASCGTAVAEAGPKVCSNCGHPIKEGVKFCASCGSPTGTVMAAAPAEGQPGVISTAGWLGTMLVLLIPIVGLILYLVWAFSSGVDVNLNRRNYCRAGLILMAVSFVLGIISSVVIFAVYGSILSLLS